MQIDILGIRLGQAGVSTARRHPWRRGRAPLEGQPSGPHAGDRPPATTTRRHGGLCLSAHHWAQQLRPAASGTAHQSAVRDAVRPKQTRTTGTMPEAIVEAASRPTMRFVTMKASSSGHPGPASTASALVHQRGGHQPSARASWARRGVVVAKSRGVPQRHARGARCRGELTATCRGLLVESLQHLDVIERRIEEADARVRRLMSSCELCRKIGAIEGIGPLTATAVVAAVGDASAFKNGRHLAAWLGLVPRQHSSGGRSKLHGISKRGDTYLRTLLIHGARSVLRWLGEKQDAHSRWLRDLIERRGFNRAAVALANKNARIIKPCSAASVHPASLPRRNTSLKSWSPLAIPATTRRKYRAPRGFAMRYEVMTNRSDQRPEILYCLSAERTEAELLLRAGCANLIGLPACKRCPKASRIHVRRNNFASPGACKGVSPYHCWRQYMRNIFATPIGCRPTRPLVG